MLGIVQKQQLEEATQNTLVRTQQQLEEARKKNVKLQKKLVMESRNRYMMMSLLVMCWAISGFMSPLCVLKFQ